MDKIYDEIFSPWTLLKIISGGTGLIAIGLLIEQRKKFSIQEENIEALIELLISVYTDENLSEEKKAKINDVIQKIEKSRGKK